MGQRFKARVLASSSLAITFAIAVAAAPFGCSRHDADEAPTDEAPQEPEWLPQHHYDAGFDSGPDSGFDSSDGRAEHEIAVLLDAGRFCGSRDLHDCPMQAWMKRNATTMLEFGDISTIAVVFDQMVMMAPSDTNEDGGLLYENWKSIARDGANASRIGNLNAAKAACRSCHSQYRTPYHANLRARDLPPLP